VGFCWPVRGRKYDRHVLDYLMMITIIIILFSTRFAAIFWVSSLFSCCTAAPFLQVGGRAVSSTSSIFPCFVHFGSKFQFYRVRSRTMHHRDFLLFFRPSSSASEQTTDTSIVSSAENSYTTVSILFSWTVRGNKGGEELLFQRNNFFPVSLNRKKFYGLSGKICPTGSRLHIQSRSLKVKYVTLKD